MDDTEELEKPQNVDLRGISFNKTFCGLREVHPDLLQKSRSVIIKPASIAELFHQLNEVQESNI